MLSSRQRRLLVEQDRTLTGAARELAAKMQGREEKPDISKAPKAPRVPRTPKGGRTPRRSKVDFDVSDADLGIDKEGDLDLAADNEVGDNFDEKLAGINKGGQGEEIPGSPGEEIKKASEALENIGLDWSSITKNAALLNALGYGKELADRINKIGDVMDDLLRQAQSDFVTRARAKDSEYVDKEILR